MAGAQPRGRKKPRLQGWREKSRVRTGEALESLRGWSLILSLMRSHLEALRMGVMAYFFVWGFVFLLLLLFSDLSSCEESRL